MQVLVDGDDYGYDARVEISLSGDERPWVETNKLTGGIVLGLDAEALADAGVRIAFPSLDHLRRWLLKVDTERKLEAFVLEGS